MATNFSLALTQLLALLKLRPAPAITRPYPKLRNFILDVMAEGRRKNIINLLFEIELAPVRAQIAQHELEHGVHLTLTSYISKALASAVDEDRSIQAYRQGKSKLVVFDEVDLSVMVEREIEGQLMPVTLIVRAANRKSLAQIAHELANAKQLPLGETGPMTALDKLFFVLPKPLRRLVWWDIRTDPNLFKQLVGTVGVTSMGMHTSGPALLIPITPMTLTLAIGAIHKKLVLEQGQPVEREFMQLNLGADHDIIDGAPLMRFAERFKRQLGDCQRGESCNLMSATPERHQIGSHR